MPEEKTENRFIKFFQRNKKLFLPFRYFVYLVGIVMIILFTLDFSFGVFLQEDPLEKYRDYHLALFYYEPYLDFSWPQHDTKNPCKDTSKEPLLIYAFGGSTMWGSYAEESETIASYISELLCKAEIPVEVSNLGIPSYVSTQEVIKLFLELSDGNVPDIVVFYDGVNDITTLGYAYRTPQAFNYLTHKMDSQISMFSSLREYLGGRFGRADLPLNFKNDILDGYFSRYKLRTADLEGEELYEKVMEIYLNNVKIVKSMEKEWGFKSFFYWQPTLYDKIDSLSEEEAVRLKEYYSNLKPIKKADPIVTEFLVSTKDVKDLRGVFSNRSDTVFLDGCHILPENNKIIAEKMVEDIIKYLNEEGYYEEK